MIRPDAGEAVRLQLGPHRATLRTLLARAAAENAEQILDEVPVLVGKDIRLGERAAFSSELRFQLVEEPEVEVDVLVGGAEERARVSARRAAAGLQLSGEEARVFDVS